MSFASKKEENTGSPEVAGILKLPTLERVVQGLPQIRPERIRLPKATCRIAIGGETLGVVDASPFGIAVEAGKGVTFPQALEEVPFLVDGIEVARLRLLEEHRTPTRDGGFKVGFSVLSDPLCIEEVLGILEAREVVESFVHKQEEVSAIPKVFRTVTLELRDMLEQIEERINKLEQHFETEYLYPEDLEVLKGSSLSVLGKLIKSLVEARVVALERTLTDVDDVMRKQAYKYFRSKLSRIIYQSPFSRRSYVKPLGYAGDYEMMNMVYYCDGLGQSLFARALHYYIVNMPGGAAVRNRARYLEGKMRELIVSRPAHLPIKILSVASGPAFELQRVLASTDEGRLADIEFHLLDQDLNSLKHAQRRLREVATRTGRACETRLFHTAIREVIQEGLDEDSYDMIYAAGVFDYFSEPVARMVVKRLYSSLAPGGQLVIGNFSTANPSRFFMEMVWDWNLIYRTDAELLRLGMSVSDDVVVDKEPLGINLFLLVKKPDFC